MGWHPSHWLSYFSRWLKFKTTNQNLIGWSLDGVSVDLQQSSPHVHQTCCQNCFLWYWSNPGWFCRFGGMILFEPIAVDTVHNWEFCCDFGACTVILVCGSWLCLVSAKLRGPFGGFQWIVVPIRHQMASFWTTFKSTHTKQMFFDHFWMLNMF